jgi:acetate kinase
VTRRDAHVLVINCGSSSIKLAVIEPVSGTCPWQALAERVGTAGGTLRIEHGDEERVTDLGRADHARALDVALAELPDIALAAVGHRVVHGGEAFSDAVVLNDAAIEAIERCTDLAPLHNPANLAGIRAAIRLRPELGQVAVFDTAFHQSMPPHAYLYAIPYRFYEAQKVRRYGFHGTSHRYVSGRASELLGRPLAELNLVTAHLGNGCSAAAVRGGKSADTTMGLTPLEGLVMGTRSGDVDPNLHHFLVDHAKLTLEQVTDLLNKESGLLGLSGESNDMRNLLELEKNGHARAALAVDVFCYRLARGLLGLCAALPTLDALVFTGGIGENSTAVRERTVKHLGVLGFVLDGERNDAHGKHSAGIVSTPGSRVTVLVVPTQEELLIARDAIAALKESRA